MDTHVVLGAGYGDEGKGLTVDHLCMVSDDPIVVRFSGGQQAGHAVMTDDGKKHVHSSFGSGTLQGVPTLLSQYCTLYLPSIYREREVLRSKGVEPTLYVHPLSMVTTPADIAYNRITEKGNKHGSCGLGVGATSKRHIETPYKLYAVDLLNRKVIFEKLTNIHLYYRSLVTPAKVEQFDAIYKEENTAFYPLLSQKLFTIMDYSILYKYKNIIFEGSQGILLDMDHGFFPNVTYANTTSKNAIKICYDMKMHRPKIYYVTRCYQTRHGYGYMSDERKLNLINNEQEINVTNDWQKHFRTGEMDYDMLNHAIDIDNCYSTFLQKNLVVTCLDQRPDFNFDYEKLRHNFESILESRSPITNLKKR